MPSGSLSALDGSAGGLPVVELRDCALAGIVPLALPPGVVARLVAIDVSTTCTLAERGARLHRAGRLCAAGLLAKFGVSGVEIARAPGGEPNWPAGFTGSITHDETLVVVAVGRVQEGLRGLGIDLAPIPPAAVADEVAAVCMNAGERRLCSAGVGDARTGVMLAFAAKEALLKCLAPVCGRRFDFLDAEITQFDAERHCLELRLLTSLGDDLPAGRCFDAMLGWNGSHVFASVALAD